MVFSRPPSLRINPCSFYLQWHHWRIPCIVWINKSFNVSSKIWQSKYVLGDMSPKCVFFWHFWRISQKYFALPPAPPCNSLGRTPLVPLPPSFNGATFTENWSGCQFTQNSSTSLASTPSTMPTCQIVLKFSFANILDIFWQFLPVLFGKYFWQSQNWAKRKCCWYFPWNIDFETPVQESHLE